jgi:hypothetical protein
MKTELNKSANANQLNKQDSGKTESKKTTVATDKNKTESTTKSSSDKEIKDKDHQHQYTTPDAKLKTKDLTIHGKGWDETPTDKKNDKK